MSDSELSEFEPYDCLDDLAADLERYTQSQFNNEDVGGMSDQNSPVFSNEWKGSRGFGDERDSRGKIAIQIRPKRANSDISQTDKSDLKKMSLRAPSIEERMAKFDVSLHRDFNVPKKSLVSMTFTQPSNKTSPRYEDEIEGIDLASKQRPRFLSDSFKPADKKEEIANNAVRKSSFTSNKLGLHVGQNLSGVHKNHESSLSDHSKQERQNAASLSVKSSIGRRPKMHSVDGGDEFPVRRKSSQGRKSLSPAGEYQQKHSRLVTAERLEGGKAAHSWREPDGDRIVHRSSGDQIIDRTQNLPNYNYNKKPDLRLSSSARVAAVITEGIQGQESHSLAQQLTGVNTQLPREKVRSVKGGIYFPSQAVRSQSSGEDHRISGSVTPGFLQREVKNISTDAGKSPSNDLSNNQTERSGSYSIQHNKKRSGFSSDGRSVDIGLKHSIKTLRKNDRVSELVRNGSSKVQEQVRSDRSTHSSQRTENPGVIYASSRAHINISQNTENNLIKSQTSASRARKNSLGLLEPRKIVSGSGFDRGKLVEKNNNTVWITDSASGSSEEERTIETDSSTTSSVIDERRRRRLVKRSRKRGLNARKSQLSQFIDREISAIESQTSDDGTSRASVDDNLGDILSPDEGIGKINSRESYKRARQIFEKSKPVEPQRISPSNKFVARVQEQENEPKENGVYTNLKEPIPRFTLIENHSAMSTVHTSRTSFMNAGLEGGNNHETFKAHRKNSGGAFTGVAKVSKITIPSLQLRSFNATSRVRYTSDTESYASQSKIVPDPFGLGRKGYRGNSSAFSDGEHELTARLEMDEERFGGHSVDDQLIDRRSYTLPRNMGRKKMKESPFQLNLPGKKRRDLMDMQCNSQSSIEDVSVKSFPLTMKDHSPNRMQSRSAGNIGIDSMIGYGTVPENTYRQGADNTLDVENSFKNSISTLSNKIDDEDCTQETAKDCSNMPASFSAVDKDVAGEIMSPVGTATSSPFLVELLAPPDSFKDSPDEQVSEELVEEKVAETVEGEVVESKESTTLPMVNHNIANETSELLEKARGRPPVTESAVIDKSHDRAGSPRRRPSYVKAQVSDSILWAESQSIKKTDIVVSRSIDESSEMLVEEQGLVNVASSERETADQKRKKSRPRIPPTLGPVKPAYDEILAIKSPGQESPLPEKTDQVKSADSYNSKEAVITEDERAVVFSEKKHEKSEIVKRRPRAILAATPMLEEIPEEKSHGSGSDTNSIRATEESQKTKKNKKQVLLGELDSTEGRDSPKTERSEKTETGYFSSSLSSISNQLSSVDDVMPADSPTFNDENFSIGNGFEQSGMLNIFKSEKTGSELLSRSDPMPDTNANENPVFPPPIDVPEIEPKWSSSSEPNLASANRTPLVEPKRAISTQEVLKIEEPKTPKDSNESGSSLRSPVGSSFEQPPFPKPRPDSQKPFSPRSSDQQSPVALVVPQQKQKHDMRKHVLQNLLDTENSYVQNLKFLETIYYKPLKKSEGGAIIESGQVDEIFFQIPEILLNHEYFLEQLNNRAKTWSDKQIIGDIFVSSFTQCLLMDAYSSFINNFLQARATVRLASMRPAFAKFLEQRCKEHKEKLTLQDLLIQPVQRIPRYVLILKDLLKHTEVKHPDYGRLQHALEQIKTLAERMNKGEMEADQAEKEAEKIRDVEATIEGVSDLVTANRKYLRQDLAAEIKGVITKKDRCLFLFSDLLVCATVRKKTNTLRRGSLGLFSGQSATDFNRYKLLWKAPLDATDLKAPPAGDKQAERIDDDIATLRKIRLMADSLVTPHPNLDLSVRELLSDLERQVSEMNSLARVELQVQTEEGPETYIFVLLSAEVRSSWEAVYEDAKQKLAYATHSFPPEFQYPLPVDKKRSGMQFTCAAPSRMASADITEAVGGDIWVCNSDGYVGHFCLVSMVPEAQSRSCVTVCSSRIQCIAPVPGSKLISTNKPRSNDPRKVHSETKSHKKSSKSSKVSSPSSLKSKKSLPSESDDDDQTPGREDIISFDTTDEEDNGIDSHFIVGPTAFGGRMSPDGSSLGTVESVEGIECSSSDDQSYRSGNDTSDGEDQSINRRIGMQIENNIHKGGQGLNQKAGLDEFLSADLDENPTMWLGTQDGCIYVYQSTSNVRKSKTKIHLGPVVNAILYQDNKVFVALASGELRVYKRDQGNGWEVNSPQSIQVGRNGASISCIAAAAGRIWCGCQNHVVLVNASTLKIESTIVVSQDSHRSVYLIVNSGLGVWISLQSSAVVRLYHATSFENLADIDVAPAVHKMLAGADAIIRQHKAACLRITALLACKDLLWIGTSAGVILTNPLPAIKVNTSSLRSAPGPTGSPHGHTGHVRFLTTVEVPKSEFKEKGSLSPEINSSRPISPPTSRTKKVIETVSRSDDSSKNITLVISGGDGYEDFRTSATSESVGRDDSTNHLLIWRV